MSVEINNLVDYPIKKDLIEKIVKDILKDKKLSIALVDKETIKKLNKDYRKKDETTDVLSFGNFQDPFYPPEIIICPFNTDNVYQVLIHGILHTLGYNHDNMKEKQDYYFKKYE